MSLESRKKMSLAKKGKKLSMEHCKKLSEVRRGRKFTDEHKANLSKANKGTISWAKGKKFTDEHKKKIGEGRLKRKALLGYLHSPETRAKMSIAFKGVHAGEKNPMFGKSGELAPGWMGGKSFEPYSSDWTKTLRHSIRQRDNFTCQECDKKQTSVTFSVHHIDYDKKNCNPTNLITLCPSCHGKTTVGDREYWKNLFKKLINTN